MVFVSGMAYYCSGKHNVQIWPYAISRFQRLVLPVWIFLSLFFLFIFIFRPEKFMNLLTVQNVFSSFLLQGFGYVWIIKVFLIIAIFSPLYVKFIQYKNGYSLAFITLAMLLVSLFIANINLSVNNNEVLNFLLDVYFSAIVYGSVFMLGYRYLNLSISERKFIFLLYFSVFIVCVVAYYIIYGKVLGPQFFKYPPSLFYIAYALTLIFIVAWVLDRVVSVKELPYLLKFISSNTIWIYLWHIPVVEYFNGYDISYSFVFKYIIALMIPVFIVFVQVHFVRRTNNIVLSKLFTGWELCIKMICWISWHSILLLILNNWALQFRCEWRSIMKI